MADERKRCETMSKEPERKRLKTEMQRLRLKDVWRQVPVFPVGAEWAQPHLVSQCNWNFSNLEVTWLHLPSDGGMKTSCVPMVVAIVSSVAPSDKLIIQKGFEEEVIDMEKLSMAWVPCIPLGEGGSSLEIPLPDISIISYVQRGATLEYVEFDPSSQCLPYFDNPYKVDVTKQSTVVDIVYPTEAGTIVSKFNWNFHGFEAIQKQNQDVEELRRTNEEDAAAFEKMRFYKFYPVATPDTPDISGAKWDLRINKYYGNAHQVVRQKSQKMEDCR
ncbi:hypothetical protein L1987_29702 [Smallanthus sonchifolius]|uniref:Uncharacterized protein n=1 Tax=Smallanthus sonchifolius TaxID=185202 RepID=A0ACB9I046_9ASTR|nr:hypothetical protein L1987_29702 [Smallanthus sonchifolius]